MKRRTLMLVTTVSFIILASCQIVGAQENDSALGQAQAQQATAPAAASAATVPRLINFSGVVKDASGKPVTGPVNLTFSLYELQEDGSLLWSEIQSVQLDTQGRYTVLLGATQADGLPLDLFTSGQARWLGVTPQLPGVGEQQPRTLLVGVPYALKAADSDTLGGLPPSAFIQSGQLTITPAGATSGSSSVFPGVAGSAGSSLPSATACPTITSSAGGTSNTVAKFDAKCDIQNSAITESSGKVGIGTTTPSATLDVNGATDLRGVFTLENTGTATATAGFNSQPVDSLASAFSSSTHAAVNQHFRWQAEPAGNDTSSPSGKFNLLFGSGAATPAETGLSISSNGLFTFASGQTFPGTGKGTVTSVGSGAGLTGGPVTGSGTLSIATGGVTNALLQNPSLTVTAGTDLTGGGAVSLGSSVALNLDTTKVPQLNASNSFTGNQSTTGNLTASGQLISTVKTGTAPLSVNSTTQVANLNASLLDGLPSIAFAQTAFENSFLAEQFIAGSAPAFTYIGDPGCGSGFAGIGFAGFSGCTNYSIIGNGLNTYLNRPSGGTLYFREGNGDEMTIVPGGPVGIGTTSPQAMLEVDAPNDTVRDGGVFVGSSESGSNTGASGLFAEGGSSGSGQGGDGIFAIGGGGSSTGEAGYFSGDVTVAGNLTKEGGSFKIDHPLDPADKYLYHSFVESPDMKNIYDGLVTLDANGEALVELPAWFQALNRDFRYQLTSVGGFAPVYIAEEISNNRFRIAGGNSGMKISWQVTGIRQDAWANAHRVKVEVEKSEGERGYYIHPELYGAPEDKGMEWARHPEMMRRMKARQASQRPQ